MSQERTCSGDPAKDDEPPQSSAASRSSECQQPGSSQERREEIDRMLAKVFTAQNMRKVPLLTGPSQWNQWTQAVENFLELEHFWATCDGMFEEGQSNRWSLARNMLSGLDGDAALEAAIYCRLGPQPLSWLRQGGYETQRRETRKIMQILKERCGT